jgi:hypothetical protein
VDLPAAPAGPSRAWSLSEALALPYGAAGGLQDAPRLASNTMTARQHSSLLRALSTKFFNVVSSVARGDTSAVEREGAEVGASGTSLLGRTVTVLPVAVLSWLIT